MTKYMKKVLRYKRHAAYLDLIIIKRRNSVMLAAGSELS